MKGQPLVLRGYIETFPICNKLDRNKSEILEGIVNWITFYVFDGKSLGIFVPFFVLKLTSDDENLVNFLQKGSVSIKAVE